MNFRKIIFTSLLIACGGIWIIVNNSKDKHEYDKSTGTIEYFGKEYGNLPHRNKGDYRYLKVDNYQFLFEIYEPNSEPTTKVIDDLKVGDIVDIYYYETQHTRSDGLNRFAQFIDRDDEPYFIRSGFQQQMGYVVLGLCIMLNIMGFVFWKKGKLNW